MNSSWINIYKPKGISSARVVSIIKQYFKKYKVGHAGTLDLEAEGVLPIAIGEATKLINILVNSSKEYVFTIKFGMKTDTADYSGQVVEHCHHIPSEEGCNNVCKQFIRKISQIPPAYSALKVNGVHAYKLARQKKKIKLPAREIIIYQLKCIKYNFYNKTATYIVCCSKGTYIRTLAEDISLSLKSLGFVQELRRTRVGEFFEKNSININCLKSQSFEKMQELVKAHSFQIEYILNQVPFSEVDFIVAKKIRFGQVVYLKSVDNSNLLWIKYNSKIIAIGKVLNNIFKSYRVINYE